jgi:hypothetical protein
MGLVAAALLGCLLADAAHAAKSKREPDACRTVADYANRGALGELIAPSTRTLPEEKRKTLFGAETFIPSNAGYWVVDLDNDGIEDDLAIGVEGTMQLGIGYARSTRPGSPVSKLLGDVDETGNEVNPDLSVVAIRGRHYVLSSSLTRSGMQRPGKLWRLGEDGLFTPVCGFTPRPAPVAELMEGKDNPVCAAVTQNLLEPVDYGQRHAIGALDDNRSWVKSPMDGLAQVDIDNDGNAENVVRINFAQRGGRACDARHIAVTDNTRTRIPNIALNRLLLDQLTNECAHNLEVYTLDGQTYVDADSEDGNRTLYQVNQDQAAVVCRFTGRLTYDVARPEKSLVADESKQRKVSKRESTAKRADAKLTPNSDSP